MDIPLPGETDSGNETAPSNTPPLVSVSTYNIPLPSCGVEFSASIPPPLQPVQISSSLLPLVPPPPPPLPKDPTDVQDDSNRYSPSRATADEECVPPLPPSRSSAIRTTVLGRAQAKKRLLAFSMTKQGGGAGLSFGFARKATGRVAGTGPAKAFTVGGTADDVMEGTDANSTIQSNSSSTNDLKKDKRRSKKTSSREDKAKAVIYAIEEIKREEMKMRGLGYGGGLLSMTDMPNPGPLPLLAQPILLPGRPKGIVEPLITMAMGDIQKLHSDSVDDNSGGRDIEKLPNKISSVGDSEGTVAEVSKSSSDRHRGEDDRDRKSNRDGRRERRRGESKRNSRTELPADWKQFHKKGYDFGEIRHLKEKLEKSKSSHDRRRRRRSSNVESGDISRCHSSATNSRTYF